MKWTSLIYGFTLVYSVLAIPLSIDGDIENSHDIISQSEISPKRLRPRRLHKKFRTAATTTTTTTELSTTLTEGFATDPVFSTQATQDNFSDVLKALNLSENAVQVEDISHTSVKTPTTNAAVDLETSPSETHPTFGLFSSEPISEPSTRIARQLFMTGNDMLDKIMNCPCQKEELTAVGVKPVEPTNNQPDPALYRAPPYGPDNLGPGDVIATNLKSAGGSTGNVFGQLIRLVLGLPNLLLSLLKPLVVGISDTLSQTADAAASGSKQAAQTIPVAFRSSAHVIRRLLETVGDVAGGLLHATSNLLGSLAAAKTSISTTLPFAFDGFGIVTGRVAQAVAPAIDFIQGTKDIVSQGVVQAAKAKANLFSGIVEGTKGFGSGLLEGIKTGVNDETPPATDGAWKR